MPNLTSRKTAGLMALRASRVNAACNFGESFLLKKQEVRPLYYRDRTEAGVQSDNPMLTRLQVLRNLRILLVPLIN
jgi:hypothetical protein